MKVKSTLLILITSFIYSCGSVSKETQVKNKIATDSYVTKIENNNTLKVKNTKGALTDTEGFKDIGTFEYSIFFDDSNELLKIINIETTNNTVKEAYYFADNTLCLVSIEDKAKTKKIYTHDGKVTSTENISDDEQKILLDKAKRFQKAFKQNH